MAYNKFERLARTAELINAGRCPSVYDLCREFEIEKRTAYEDIRALRDFMHMAIKYDNNRRGYINEDPKKKLPEFDLTEGEIFALTLGKDMLSEYGGTAFEPVLRAAVEKISSRLPERVKIDVGDLSAQVRFLASGIAPVNRRLFFELNKACEELHPIHIVYSAAYTGETTERKVDPYKLIESRGAWYVIGYCHLRKDRRMFALHRIQEHRVLRSEKFQRPDANELDNWITSAFQLEHGDPEMEYKIKFTPTTSRYIRERQWHPSQKLIEDKDGSCTLSFTAMRLDEIKRWVLTFGAEAEVLAPEQLRQELKKEFARAAKLY